MKEFFDYTIFGYGKYELTVAVLLKVIILVIVIKFILWLIRKSIYSASSIEVSKKYAVYNLIKYVIIVFSFIAAFQILGFNFTLLLGGAAALLVGIGLGLQSIFSDFISGIILLVESKIKINDIVEVDGLLCRVVDINLRTTTVLGRDDKYIILPNSLLTKNSIINWTYTDVASRFKVTVGAGYTSDIRLVKKLLMEIISNQPGALKSPNPFVRFEDFADSYLLFSIYFWSEDVYGVENIKSEIRTKIFEKFRDNNIDISLPQRVLHFENQELTIRLKQNEQATPDESGS
ncbi:MAG: mechanosensitive ion channel domain-containing protein [Ginsengibacter sp.]|jgi:small-conductance mechanosensitive channel